MDANSPHIFNGPANPRGILVAIGGNEDKENDLEILRTTINLSPASNPKIALITSASCIPEEVAIKYLGAFKKMNRDNVEVVHIKDRNDAHSEEKLQIIADADIVYFTGGDQLRITSILGGSPILEEIKRKYLNEECIVAGTSAGASALSETMIYEGESPEALKKGTVQMTAGIALIRCVVIDSHFIKRGRFSRLMETVTTNPGVIGLGLGEDTGVIVRDGHILEAIGNGLIVIFDGMNILHSNITNVKLGEAIAVQNVVVHTLVKGYGYDTKSRAYIIKKPEPIPDTGEM